MARAGLLQHLSQLAFQSPTCCSELSGSSNQPVQEPLSSGSVGMDVDSSEFHHQSSSSSSSRHEAQPGRPQVTGSSNAGMDQDGPDFHQTGNGIGADVKHSKAYNCRHEGNAAGRPNLRQALVKGLLMAYLRAAGQQAKDQRRLCIPGMLHILCQPFLWQRCLPFLRISLLPSWHRMLT